MSELAKAYVQIIPSAEGIKGKLTGIMDGEAESAGQSSGSSFSSGFSKTVGAVAKVGAAALGAAAATAGKLVKDAVAGYAEYEQLAGGLATMFEDLSYDVEMNAKNAFKTAGLSANEYMETVMGFSASLNQSLIANEGNIARAADLSDQIITDMADNANKMGTSMESIQNAYAGFAKQNYTMLDNLKLGYGGTKEEMERLLSDAEKLTGKEFDVSNFADIAEAIHAVQSEMGITGTTALEAGETISGSIGMMKSAWDNLVIGIANPDADIGSLISDVVDSATVAAGNLIPAIETGLSGISQLITGLAPVITGALPSLISGVLPDLVSTAQSLVMSTAEALISNLPLIAETGISLLMELATSISAALPELIPVAVDAILELVNTLTDPANIGMLIDASIAIIIGLANGLISALPQLLAQAPVIISNLVTSIIENGPKLLDAAWELVKTLGSGIINNLGEIGRAAGEIIGALVDGVANLFSDIWTIGQDIVMGIWQGIKDHWEWFKGQISGFFTGIVDGVKETLGIASPSKVFAGIGTNMALGLGEGFESTMGKVERDMMSSITAPAVDVAVAGAYRFSGAAEGGVLAAGTAQADTADIISAVMAVGNMIVAAVQAIDPDIQLDGASLAAKLLPYSQAETKRVGSAMVV